MLPARVERSARAAWFDVPRSAWSGVFFFFDDAATAGIYTLSLHDDLPILPQSFLLVIAPNMSVLCWTAAARSEEHTSELQSRRELVCRLLLEKKKQLVSDDLKGEGLHLNLHVA